MATSASPAPPSAGSAPPSRAQLIHIETDRRLGHEWDEWNGLPLPAGGDFSAPAATFFWFAALAMAVAGALGWGVLFLLAPRIAEIWAPLAKLFELTWGGLVGISWLWFGALLGSYAGGKNLLPERWLERGPFLHVMNLTSLVSRVFRRRDWVEHAAIDVYNTLAVRRGRSVGRGELLVLIPRCLSEARPSTACCPSPVATTSPCSWRRAVSWRAA